MRETTRAAMTEALGDALDRKGWLQTDLARALSVSDVTISRFFTGKQFPRPDMLDRMAHVLGCRVHITLEPLE